MGSDGQQYAGPLLCNDCRYLRWERSVRAFVYRFGREGGGVASMVAPTTVFEKAEAQKAMREEQRRIGAAIDRLAAQSAAEQEAMVTGCGGQGVVCAIVRTLGRWLGIHRRVESQSTEQMMSAADARSAAASSGSAAGSVSTSRISAGSASRVFGVARQKADPSVKLEQAASAMRGRVTALEQRAEEARVAAARAMRAKQKGVAMRELKRAKALEAQAASTQSALDALEAQSDMLEQTALQREVAAAIGATAKTLKKDKKLLSKAEDAVDAAGELRDLHADITSVMGELGDQSKYDYDDDELMAELNGMVQEVQQLEQLEQLEQQQQQQQQQCEQSSQEAGLAYDGAACNGAAAVAVVATGLDAQAATATSARLAAAELERRHAAYDEAERLRRGLPAVPTEIAEKETQRLLHAGSC